MCSHKVDDPGGETEEEEELFVFIGYCRGTGAPAVKLTARHSSQLGLCNYGGLIDPTFRGAGGVD